MKKDQRLTFRGKYFFGAVCLCYLIVLLVDSPGVFQALTNCLKVLVRVLPILLFVMVLTSWFSFVLNPKAITTYMGDRSGVRGWTIALVGGLLSHGPMYIWYPMIENLRKRGLKDYFIITFYFARAVKLPLLPFMVDSFGLLYTSVFTIYIIFAALLQGVLYSFLQPRSH